MKYIDADLLRKEIESLKSLEYPCDNSEQNFGFEYALDRLSDLLGSLQQEQQEVDLEKEIEEYWVATEWSKKITLGKFKVIARYFYGLGQLNSK